MKRILVNIVNKYFIIVLLNLIMLVFISIPIQVIAQIKRPNILFLLADDMRADCISGLGNSRIKTPNLDRLIEKGMVFNRATCSYPICVASRSEILTGMQTWQISKEESNNPLKWGEAFQRAGYETLYVGKWHVKGRPDDYGFVKAAGLFSMGGKKYWKEGSKDWKGFPITGYVGAIFQSMDGKILYPNEGVGLSPNINNKFIDSAIWLIEDSKQPWMCHINFTAPHDPLFIPKDFENKVQMEDMRLPENYLPKHPFDIGTYNNRDEKLLGMPRTESAVKDLLRVYYSVIEGLDSQIGRIIQMLENNGQLENTIIIFSSDHGLACGSHGLRGKQNLYEHTINVPLIISGPGIKPGSHTDAQVYLRELYPTTCDLVGINAPESIASNSFIKVLKEEECSIHSEIFGQFSNTQRMVRSNDGWKLIFYPQIDYYQLFYINEDPYEMNNLFEYTESVAFYQKKFIELKRSLSKWREVNGDPLLMK